MVDIFAYYPIFRELGDSKYLMYIFLYYLNDLSLIYEILVIKLKRCKNILINYIFFYSLNWSIIKTNIINKIIIKL